MAFRYFCAVTDAADFARKRVSRELAAESGRALLRAIAKLEADLAAARSALASQTRHATTLGAALTGDWQEDAWTDLPQLVYRPSCRPAPQRMESML